MNGNIKIKYISIFSGADGPDFVSKPENPTISKVGSVVELSWHFKSSQPYSFISINRVSESDAHIGTIVIVVPNTAPIIVGKFGYLKSYVSMKCF